ncbi:cytokine receptor family member b1 [Plectropomus leopardus]|uniref:cytokine receptor family member b1 n=1 Tax=Plectropomus leopardus TaxID=160734 RepID=UPI001C4DB521|nr:cytokine receptor family member b1 [Plectropomus leopardus]
MMICLHLLLHLLLLLDPVLTSLPAPVNLNISSVNFHHVLRWDPGPGTPPGTQYKIIRRVNKKKQKQLPYSTETFYILKLPRYQVEYGLTVQAFYNQTWSPESSKLFFTPFEDTKIGPPGVSLAGCGNCIQINISLPEAEKRSKIIDIEKIYDVKFIIYWKKIKDTDKDIGKDSDTKTAKCVITEDKSYTLSNLQTGMKFCVQVHIEINVNKHTVPSPWKCTFTSIVDSSKNPVVLGAVAALLIFAFGTLMTSMFCLHYTGFLCKLRETLPEVLIEALSQGYILTPERMIPSKIYLSMETDKPRRHNNLPQPATGGANSDEEDEGEEGENAYMERGAELSSADSSCQGSVDVSGTSKEAASGNSGTVEAEVADTEFEPEVTHWECDQEDAKTEGAKVFIMSEGGQTEVQGHVTGEVQEEEKEEEEEVCNSSGNINLFSVTLAALTVSEEEEEEEEQNTRDSHTGSLKLSGLEPLLPADSKQSVRLTDSQYESDQQTAVALMPPPQDSAVTGYEGRHEDTFSGYLKN